MPCDQCVRSKAEYCNYLQNSNAHTESFRYSLKGRVAARQSYPGHREQQPISTIGHDIGTCETQLASPASIRSTDSNDGEDIQDGSLNDYSHGSEIMSSPLPVRGVFVGQQFFGPSHWMNSISQVSTTAHPSLKKSTVADIRHNRISFSKSTLCNADTNKDLKRACTGSASSWSDRS